MFPHERYFAIQMFYAIPEVIPELMYMVVEIKTYERTWHHTNNILQYTYLTIKYNNVCFIEFPQNKILYTFLVGLVFNIYINNLLIC